MMSTNNASSNTANGKKNVGAGGAGGGTGVLGLAPMQPQSAGSLGLTRAEPVSSPQYPSNQAITKRERQILDSFHEEVAVIDATEAKAEIGMYKIGQMQERASDLFSDTVGFLLQNKEAARGTEAELYVAEFTQRQVQMYARHMLGTLEVGGTRIGEEVHRSLYLPPEQKGFWAQKLGK